MLDSASQISLSFQKPARAAHISLSIARAFAKARTEKCGESKSHPFWPTGPHKIPYSEVGQSPLAKSIFLSCFHIQAITLLIAIGSCSRLPFLKTHFSFFNLSGHFSPSPCLPRQHSLILCSNLVVTPSPNNRAPLESPQLPDLSLPAHPSPPQKNPYCTKLVDSVQGAISPTSG